MAEPNEVWTPAKGVRVLAEEEFIEEFGAERLASLMGESGPELPPEDAKRLGEKMQQQAGVNSALHAAGARLDDLFVEGDDEPSDLEARSNPPDTDGRRDGLPATDGD